MSSSTPTASFRNPFSWERLKFIGLVLQLGLLVLVMRQFQLESGALTRIAELSLVGFVIHSLLPRRYRLPFFVLLSFAGILLVLGVREGLWLIGLGLALIGLCHLPISFKARLVLILVVAVLLVASRVGSVQVPWSVGIWPILGSMFMFRFVIYLYDLRAGKIKPTLGSTLSYFFLLPNAVAPLFPVVDYRTFRRTYYNEEDLGIYQRGIKWMLRGVMHLILYRIVYYYFVLSPDQIQSTSDLIQFLLTNYLLYLRISGLFHIFIGMLLLFGFNLPPTHHLYFLASSFTDYWRRINIYWKDFMTKIFYYPSFFGLRRLGSTSALVMSMIVVFAATMLLHSYQWFWIRGALPITAQDSMFWSILAALVIVNALYESKRGRERHLRGVTWGELPGLALRTAATFVVLCVLWSLWTADSVPEWTAMWSVVDFRVVLERPSGPILVAAAVFATTATLRVWRGKLGARPIPKFRGSGRTTVLLLVGLYLIGNPIVYSRFDPVWSRFLSSIQQEGLNPTDQARLERGYYENLLGVQRFNAELWNLWSKQPVDWKHLWQTGAVQPVNGTLRTELKPLVDMSYKGKQFTTNSWGMRDQEYTKEKPSGVYRLAVLGSSPVMGSGVGDSETFEQLLERKLSDADASEHPAPIEVLNFGMEAYALPQQVVMVEERVLPFNPDVVLYVAHETEAEKAVGQVATLVAAGTDIAIPELNAIISATGIESGVPMTNAVRSLAPVADEILAAGYRRIVERVRRAGGEPIWVFIPMPAAGAVAPCPPEREATCWGNAARPGATADRSDPRVDRLFSAAESSGFRTLDLSGVYGDRSLESLWIAEWDSHPNADGHRLIAEKLYEVMMASGLLPRAAEAATALSVDAKEVDNGTDD